MSAVKTSPSLRLCASALKNKISIRACVSALRISALVAAALPALAFYPPVDSRDGVTARFAGFEEKIPADAMFTPKDRKVVLAEKHDASKPFEFRLDIANDTAAPVSGDLRIWMGDDWEVVWKNNLAQSPQSTQSSNETLCASVPLCETNETSRTSRTSREENNSRPATLALPCALSAHSTNSFFATAVPRPGRVLPALYPIHASFAFPGGEALHPIAIFEAVADAKQNLAQSATENNLAQSPTENNLAQSPQSPPSSNETLCASVSLCETNETSRTSRTSREAPESPIRLAFLPGETFTQMPGAEPKPISEEGETTGAFFETGWQAADGDMRYGFFSQPPWRTGGGLIWRDFPVSLPQAERLSLHFSAAIRSPLHAGEGRSDGAGYKVFVVEAGGKATEVHSSLVKSLSWQDATADLTPWAGKAVTLRLWNDCGPANEPSYDRCLWGDVGVVADGTAHRAAPRSENRENGAHEFQLSVRGEAWTATISPGPCGLFDGTISFTDGERTLSFTGFTCAIDDIAVGTGPIAARCTGWEVAADGAANAGSEEASAGAVGNAGFVEAAPSASILHRISLGSGRTIFARATISADGPALRIRWDMPGTIRDDRGSPRFTRLGIGPASLPAERAYVGFGNVLEEPRSFALTGGLFRNMASHAGADYANGVSLCQASELLPDRILCRREANVFAVETCHDATLSFVPSARGAFAAARAWRDVSGHRRSPAWREAATRLCLDQWGGGANKSVTIAAMLDKYAKYGVSDMVYIRHVWQRWGFDYRLPEIWPPSPVYSPKPGEFEEMREAAKRNGILFTLHDNYIDHYPDSEGFSYDDTVFDETGAPFKAWFNFNKGKRAQSYRWAPGAFMPWLRANAATLRDAIAPDGFFIDVWSNMAPFDWYDRAGRFHDRVETREAWAEGVDEYRRVLGGKGVAIGEGGHDGLVGHFDAAQPDHLTPRTWMDRGEYADSERIPWQDMVTHGRFVLYGGGLGWRYGSDSTARGGDPAKGSTSDSYLCTTVMGGRTPLHDIDPKKLDFRAVDTWWLIGGVSRTLALSEFESFDFEGSIHRQHAVFAGGEGGGGQVWVNRPGAGVAPAPSFDRSIVGSFDRSLSASTDDSTAKRPNDQTAKRPNDQTTKRPNDQTTKRPNDSTKHSGSWFLPNGLALPPDGFYAETASARAGIVEIAGRRCAFSEAGGTIFVDGRPDRRDGTGPADTANAAALADFAACGIAVKTDGAFRLQREASGALLLTPVPDSRPFRAEIDLAAAQARLLSPSADAAVGRISNGGSVAGAPSPAVEPVEPMPGAAAPEWRQEGDTLSLAVDAKAFAYRIAF